MATIVNNPPAENRNNGNGLIIGIIVLIVLALLFFYYGLPAIQNTGGTQVNVPEQVDVNVDTQNQPTE